MAAGQCAAALAVLFLPVLARAGSAIDNLVMGSDPRKPIETDARLLCHACRAIVHQTDHRFRHTPKRDPADVIEFLDEVCDVKYLKIYESIPPKMKKGCQEFLAEHSGDELEAALIAGGEGSSDKLCLELTGICEGIDWKKPNVAGYEGYVPPDPRPDPDLQKKKKSGKKGKKKQHGTAGDPAPSGNEKEEL